MEWSAGKVLTALRTGPFREPAHAWLENVRNETGFGSRPRYADAVVVSLWPSRGLWIGGIEVKISRNDWLRELDKPNKSAEIQRFCDYWWVAAPEGVVEKTEVPETWGYYLVNSTGKQRVRAVKAAPKLQPEPLKLHFVASVLRNQSECANRLRQLGHHEGFEKARAEHDPSVVERLRKELNEKGRAHDLLRLDLERTQAELSRLREHIASFERASGVTGLQHCTSYSYRGELGASLGEQFKLAQLLGQQHPKQLAQKLIDAGNALLAVTDLAQPEKTGT